MSDLNSYYDNFPDDKSERKKKRKHIYSSKDFIPGIRGVLAKLLVSFIIFVMSTGLISVIFSIFMFIGEMLFIAIFSAVMMLASWAGSVLFKDKANIFKILPLIILTGAAYLFSPYDILVTAIVLAYNFIVSMIVVSRLNLPEKIALSQTLIIISCLFFCMFQVLLFLDPFQTVSSQQAKPVFITAGVIWLIMCVFILNVMNIRRISPGRKFTKAMIGGNITLTVIFAGLVMIVANIGAYKEAVLNIIRKVLQFLLGGSSEEAVPMETAAPQGDGMDLSALAEDSGPSPFWEFMEKVFLIIAVILMAFLVYWIVKNLIKLFKRLYFKMIDYFGGVDSSTSINAYEDKEESIFDKNHFTDALKNRWNKLRENLKRKPRFSDMETNRQRVRFLYKLLLKAGKDQARPAKQSATAREYLVDADATIEKETFLSGYEKARYSNHDVSDEEVQAGLSFVGK